MFPATTKGGGQCIAFPDVCKVPAPPTPFIPTPFPNIAMPNQSSGTASKVKICGKETLTKSSKITRSSGDEAGTLKGMISMVNMDKAGYRMGSSKVKAEGNAVVTVLKNTAHNGMNANAPPGAQVAPSQTTVILMG